MQFSALHHKDSELAVAVATQADLTAQLQQHAAEREGIGPDLEAIAQPIERMRNSGTTLADKVSLVAVLRPPHVWLDEVTKDEISGGATDDALIAQYVRALHNRLGMPVVQGPRNAKMLRATYVGFTLKVGVQ